MLLMCLKIFRKSIDKKALRQGRHLMLLFPPPKIMLSKEETSRKIHFLPKFLHYFHCYVMFKLSFALLDLYTFWRLTYFTILRDFSYNFISQTYLLICTTLLILLPFWWYLLSLLSNKRYFAWFLICMDSLCVIFMISIADLSAARSQELSFMLHKSISWKL